MPVRFDPVPSMRRLFIALLPLLFVGCDRQSPEPSPFLGRWVLVSASNGDAEVEAPLGSVLDLRAGGQLSIESGNDCDGRHDWREDEATGRRAITLTLLACTEIGTTPETDLALFLHTLLFPGESAYQETYQIGAQLVEWGDSPTLLFQFGTLRLAFEER